MVSNFVKLCNIAVLLPALLVHGAVGIDGKALSGSFNPTKCRLDRDDDLFDGGLCARCVTNEQCRDAYGGSQWYCCPFMKRCVNSGSMGCYDTAFCRPRCWNEEYPALKEDCSGCDSKFPDNWVLGCMREDWAGLVGGAGGEEDVGPESKDDSSDASRDTEFITGDGSGMQAGAIPETSLGGRTSSDPENVRDVTDKCWEVTEAAEKYNGIYVPCSIAVVQRFFSKYDNYRCWNKQFLDKGAKTAYSDPVMVFSWKWFMSAAYPIYESFNKKEPVDWVVSSKYGSGTRVPTVTEVACATVDYGYVCENNGCSTRSMVLDRDYGFYSQTDGDCEACVTACTANAGKCGGVECGQAAGRCMWWAHGKCESGSVGNTGAFTCRRYNTDIGAGSRDEQGGGKNEAEPSASSDGEESEDSEEGGAAVQGPCARIGDDGKKCTDAVGCVWDWDLYTCLGDGVVDLDLCASLEGPECVGSSACTWDWTSKTCSGNKVTVELDPCHALEGPECNDSCFSNWCCTWDWDAHSCVGNGDEVEELDPCQPISGPECVKSSSCTWDWDADGCVSKEDECKAHGTDGPACLKTKGCRWDWLTFTCATAEEPSTNSCASATNAKQCKKLAGCTFDKSTRVCLPPSTDGGSQKDKEENAGADKCTGLAKQKCRKTAGCALDGRTCKLADEEESSGGVTAEIGDSTTASCTDLKRAACSATAGCKWSKKRCGPK